MATGKNKQGSHRVAVSSDVEVSTYLEIAKGRKREQPLTENEEQFRAEREVVVIIDFGSQYSWLIARRVRECHVYCEVLPYDAPWEKIALLQPKGFILSGGPASVYEKGAPQAQPYIYESNLPVLGICYGMQVIVHQLGGRVAPGLKHEYGLAILRHDSATNALFAGLPAEMPVWMSHGDRIEEMPPGFTVLASTDNSPVAAMGNDEGIIGLQFHPEVAHTPQGKDILRNFLYNICGCSGNWTPSSFVADSIERIREQVGGGRVICALSGGVDSAVVATLVHRAIGDQLTCIFV